jgi:hypothetical protein
MSSLSVRNWYPCDGGVLRLGFNFADSLLIHAESNASPNQPGKADPIRPILSREDRKYMDMEASSQCEELAAEG